MIKMNIKMIKVFMKIIHLNDYELFEKANNYIPLINMI